MGHAGRRIWIIGASAGIGAALARALAGQGAQLILSARDGDALEVLATECGGAQALPLDLGQPETLAAVVKRLALEAPLDAIICTAALYDPGRVADIDPAQAEAMVRVNILGHDRGRPPMPPAAARRWTVGAVRLGCGLYRSAGGSLIQRPRLR
ncbi:SDR family NAD(P)-dependent oxidoreductase [Paracoccus sp. DMF-8]|uniref:SDR family NAD(P)-dependent oxidoreductase n=1 Tax=Paracoccus sp. DMF-8 TaxID=3019445 RepID=UPI0023E875FD|nr:SDR family NAD(P)-dependent oxidoreductase [Paracoccus sp. DMF-8]MDF3605349.1 SDR family NAD(P)-dependent oxidoreductase [Paracoccus sp. DMF-8]